MSLWTISNIGEGRLDHQQALVMGSTGAPHVHIEYHKANQIKNYHNNEVKKYQQEIEDLKKELNILKNISKIDIIEPVPEFDEVIPNNFWDLL